MRHWKMWFVHDSEGSFVQRHESEKDLNRIYTVCNWLPTTYVALVKVTFSQVFVCPREKNSGGVGQSIFCPVPARGRAGDGVGASCPGPAQGERGGYPG